MRSGERSRRCCDGVYLYSMPFSLQLSCCHQTCRSRPDNSLQKHRA